MKHTRWIWMVLVGLLFLGGCGGEVYCSSLSSSSKKDALFEPGVLVQVGTLQGLAAGEYDGTVALSELYYRQDGNIHSLSGVIGVGTFDALDGEMVILDGRCYRVGVDGYVTVMKPTDTTPFANLVYMDGGDNLFDWNPWKQSGQQESGVFEVRRRERFDCRTLSELKAKLFAAIRKFEKLKDGQEPTRAYAFCIHGEFASVKTRSVPKQAKPYRKLLDVVKTGQVVFQIDPDPADPFDVKGTIMGFYFPASMKGVNVHGFHFLTDDCSAGGHLLNFEYRGAPLSKSLDVCGIPLEKDIFWLGKKGVARETSAADIRVIEQGK